MKLGDEGTLFWDAVDGRAVRHYIDRKGKHWMANGRWSWFRIALDRRNK